MIYDILLVICIGLENTCKLFLSLLSCVLLSFSSSSPLSPADSSCLMLKYYLIHRYDFLHYAECMHSLAIGWIYRLCRWKSALLLSDRRCSLDSYVASAQVAADRNDYRGVFRIVLSLGSSRASPFRTIKGADGVLITDDIEIDER